MRRTATFAQENEYLRAQVRQLQDALGIGLHWPAEWNLSQRETALLGVLVSREVATRDGIMCALYGDRPNPPCERIINVFMYKLRSKLAPRGFTILTRRAHGFAIPPEQRARLRALASR
jgi:two-component system cell cycle response regulator CtrA